MVVSSDRSWKILSRNWLPLQLLGATELKNHAGVVGMDEAREWFLAGVLESKGNEGIVVTIHPSPVELDPAGDACSGSVGGLSLGWLVLQELESNTGNCDARLCQQGFSGALHGQRLHGQLSSLLALVLALPLLCPFLAG